MCVCVFVCICSSSTKDRREVDQESCGDGGEVVVQAQPQPSVITTRINEKVVNTCIDASSIVGLSIGLFWVRMNGLCVSIGCGSNF